jgi:polar amino acid transport system substrate-binding protein/cystine transport system substrate-binding protein/membrane-bound lytic murein transglycosylase F
VVSPEPVAGFAGLKVGVLTLVSGLGRIELASYLRAAGANVVVVARPEALIAGIADRRFDAGITEALLASRLAADNGWKAAWMPPELVRNNLVFGLWKGDVTLKRAVDRAVGELVGDGTVAAIRARYAAASVD